MAYQWRWWGVAESESTPGLIHSTPAHQHTAQSTPGLILDPLPQSEAAGAEPLTLDQQCSVSGSGCGKWGSDSSWWVGARWVSLWWEQREHHPCNVFIKWELLLIMWEQLGASQRKGAHSTSYGSTLPVMSSILWQQRNPPSSTGS